jgi:hypothetical protein
MRQARPYPSSCPRLLGEVVEQQPQASSPNIMQAVPGGRFFRRGSRLGAGAEQLAAARRARDGFPLAGGEGLEAR